MNVHTHAIKTWKSNVREAKKQEVNTPHDLSTWSTYRRRSWIASKRNSSEVIYLEDGQQNPKLFTPDFGIIGVRPSFLVAKETSSDVPEQGLCSSGDIHRAKDNMATSVSCIS